MNASESLRDCASSSTVVDRACEDGRWPCWTNRHPTYGISAERVIECHVPSMGDAFECRRSEDFAAISRDSESNPRNRINPDDIGTDSRIYVASKSKVEPHGSEWTRLHQDGEIGKFLNGELATVATRNNPKRRCRTSISSGYSSHSSPLSSGSYSCYASASTSTRDPSSWYGDLAVIHETETIPRPIWPSALYHHSENTNINCEDIYMCHMCGCTYGYPLQRTPLPAPRTVTREMLLQLSRTLNSVIDGDAAVTLEDVLRDISRIIPLGTGTRNDHVYENVYPSWMFGEKNLSILPNYIGNQVPSGASAVDSKLHVAPRYFYGYNSVRSVPLLKKAAWKTTRSERNNKEINVSSHAEEESCDTAEPYVREYLRDKSSCTKQLFRAGETSKRCGNSRISTESIYPMRSEDSDIGSSSEGTTASLNGTDWNHRSISRSLPTVPDFTLDVTRAEHLGRTIAKAKRNRQWCRILTTLFGLVFFVLSVVVVSLSVTRGRKVFGSM